MMKQFKFLNKELYGEYKIAKPKAEKDENKYSLFPAGFFII